MNALHSAFSPSIEVQSDAQRDIVRALYREHSARLVTYAARILRDRDAADDVVQDAFVSMLAGEVAVPAVDVVRQLQTTIRCLCSARREEMARERRTRRMRQEARRAYAATLRSRERGGGFDFDWYDREVRL